MRNHPFFIWLVCGSGNDNFSRVHVNNDEWGTIRIVEDGAELLEQLRDRSYPGKAERATLFQIDAWDVNCPQHIHKRLTQKQLPQ